MKTLAIETTENIGSVAVLDGSELLVERRLDAAQRTAQSLAVGMREILIQCEWSPAEIDLVAVASGPGSFTGLRVGVTAAKTFAYATGASVLGVNTLAVIAAGAPLGDGPIWVAMDAQRQELFVAKFACGDGPADLTESLQETQLTDVDSWLQSLSADDLVTGPALGKLAGRLPADIRKLERQYWAPRAEWVGKLAVADYVAGRRDDVWQLVPQYFRKSAAEEKAEAGQHQT